MYVLRPFHYLCAALVAVTLLSDMSFGQNPPFDVGIEAGRRIPSFSLTDQDGKVRDFSSLKGAKGVVLLFFRSADW
jgi:cytochrome oxidase Cu insertion factor (SCO1/SenC/PrrC family)